jgi:hypothetical protein
MSLTAFSQNSGEFTLNFKSEFGRTPTLKEYRNWESVASECKQKLAASANTQSADPEWSAYQDWHKQDVNTTVRAGWLLMIHRYQNDSSESKYWEAMREHAQGDKDCRYVLSFLAGFVTAVRAAERRRCHLRDLEKPDLSTPAANAGWLRARSTRPFPSVVEISAYLSNSYLTRL